jgi:hypothetical protein
MMRFRVMHHMMPLVMDHAAMMYGTMPLRHGKTGHADKQGSCQ